MIVPPQRCAKCDEVLPQDSWTCPACGADLSGLPVEADSPRSPLWKYFWILFLATPCVSVGVLIPNPISRRLISWLGLSSEPVQLFMAGLLLGLGTLATALLLARIYTGTIRSVAESRTRSGFLRVKRPGKAGVLLLIYTLVFGCGISVIYAGVAFVGCAALERFGFLQF